MRRKQDLAKVVFKIREDVIGQDSRGKPDTVRLDFKTFVADGEDGNMERDLRYGRQLIRAPLENHCLIVHLDKITLPSSLACLYVFPGLIPWSRSIYCGNFWKICSAFKIWFRSVSFIRIFIQYKFIEDQYPTLFLESEWVNEIKIIEHTSFIPLLFLPHVHWTAPYTQLFCPLLYLFPLNFVCDYDSTT